jgi:hypothetical protein
MIYIVYATKEEQREEKMERTINEAGMANTQVRKKISFLSPTS